MSFEEVVKEYLRAGRGQTPGLLQALGEVMEAERLERAFHNANLFLERLVEEIAKNGKVNVQEVSATIALMATLNEDVSEIAMEEGNATG